MTKNGFNVLTILVYCYYFFTLSKISTYQTSNYILWARYVHCVKTDQIWSFFWSVFSLIWTEYGEISLRIQSECGKIQTRKNSVFEHFSRSGGAPKFREIWKL